MIRVLTPSENLSAALYGSVILVALRSCACALSPNWESVSKVVLRWEVCFEARHITKACSAVLNEHIVHTGECCLYLCLKCKLFFFFLWECVS